MIRAYRKISGRSEVEVEGEQIDLDTPWLEFQED